MTQRWDKATWAVLALAATLLLSGLGSRGLNEPDEGRFAEIGREMAAQSNWMMPYLGGVPHLQKPPLVYWLTALSIRAFGVNEWAARLPSALAALGTVVLILHLAGLLFGASVRWKAGLMLLSSALFFMLARLITTDMLLTFCITGAVTSFVHYTMRRSAGALFLFYISLGLGFLAKGPMAFMVPLCAVIPWAVVHGRDHTAPAWRWHWWPGLPLALTLGLSWFLVLLMQYPQLLDYFVRYEFIDRIASNVHKRSKPFWFYTAMLIGGLMPWTGLIPGFLRDTWRRVRPQRSPVCWLMAGWILLPLAILHVVTSKLPTYLLPLLPPLAIVLAHGWHTTPTAGRRAIRGLALLLSAAAGVSLVLFALGPVYRTTTLTLSPALGIGLALIATGWLALVALTRNDASTTRLMTGAALMMTVSMLFLSSLADRLLHGGNASMRSIAEAVRVEEAARGPATVFSCNIQAYGLDFYLQRLIHRTVPQANHVLPMPPEAAALIVDDPAGFLAQTSTNHVLVLVKASRFAKDPLFSGWQMLAQSGSMVLVRRRSGP